MNSDLGGLRMKKNYSKYEWGKIYQEIKLSYVTKEKKHLLRPLRDVYL